MVCACRRIKHLGDGDIVQMTNQYGDGENFDYSGSAMFRKAMRQCDDCYAEQPLAWWGHNIRICERCSDLRLARAHQEGK